MRKLSEIFEIVKPFHVSYGGTAHGMCIAAIRASLDGLITLEEEDELELFCTELVEEFPDVDNEEFGFLGSMLVHYVFPEEPTYDFSSGWSSRIEQVMGQVYDAVIDKLVADGL